MSTYYEFIFGYSTEIYELLEKGFGFYNKGEFMQLLNHAKKENDALKIENERLKKEIATMNINIVASLERDILHMHKELNKVNTYIPKYNRTVEDLDP